MSGLDRASFVFEVLFKTGFTAYDIFCMNDFILILQDTNKLFKRTNTCTCVTMNHFMYVGFIDFWFDQSTCSVNCTSNRYIINPIGYQLTIHTL